MYFKYAFLLKFVYCSFLFGFMLPLMFPLTLIALINFYITEKLALAYFYKSPPNLDNKISKKAIELFRTPAFLGLLVAFWAASNKQLFLNDLEVIKNSAMPSNPHHSLYKIWEAPLPHR